MIIVKYYLVIYFSTIKQQTNKKEIIINQQEWIEYFELVNGRKPTPAELYQAQATGEFILERPNILSSNEQVREQRPTKPA